MPGGLRQPDLPPLPELAPSPGRPSWSPAPARSPLDPATRLGRPLPRVRDATASLPEGDINNASVVLLLERGGFRALLTGDAERRSRRLLVSRGLLGAGRRPEGRPPRVRTRAPRPALLAAVRPRLRSSRPGWTTSTAIRTRTLAHLAGHVDRDPAHRSGGHDRGGERRRAARGLLGGSSRRGPAGRTGAP